MFTQIRNQTRQAIGELLEQAKATPGQVLVVGCSSSEIMGKRIGKGSSMEAARAVLDGLTPLLAKNKLFLAAQCCEHLNRALVVERELAEARDWEIVNALPVPDAGGSFATVVYAFMKAPVLVAAIQADLGLDIGGTLMGMHLKRVAVPVRLSLDTIGEARLLCARTRPPYIGGPRAQYP